MEEFLKKVGLIDTMTLKLNVERRDFVSAFKNIVEDGPIGWFSDLVDVFSSSKKEYKGHVGADTFEIKRRRRFFDMNRNVATAKGTFRQSENELVVNAEIDGFKRWMLPFLFLLFSFYLIAVGIILLTESAEDFPLVVVPAIFVHALIILSIPYFVARRNVKRLKYDLERELFYLSRNKTDDRA